MAERPDLRVVAPTISHLLGVEAPVHAEVGPHSEVLETLKQSQRLTVLVIDAFGVQVWESLRGTLPNLDRLAGFHRAEIRSLVPSLTYVCMATMVTGVLPESHGIGEREQMQAAAEAGAVDTVFNRLREAGMVTMLAVHRRDVEGVPVERFADHCLLAEERNDRELFEKLPEMLTRFEPTFTFAHFLDVDEAGHAYGPGSQEVRKAAASIDSRLGGLLRCLSDLGSDVLLLADHGMHAVSGGGDEEGHLGTHDGSVEEDLAVPLVWASASELQSVSW